MKTLLLMSTLLALSVSSIWALKGSALVVASTSYYQAGDIVLVTINGPQKTSTTIVTGLCTGPCFSPDGTKIAYAKTGTIYTCNRDGTGTTTIIACGQVPALTNNCVALNWTTTGYLYWSEGSFEGTTTGPGHLYRVNVSTKVKETVHTTTKGRMWTASVSRDGTRAAAWIKPVNQSVSFTIGNASSEVVLSDGCQTSISPDGQLVTDANQTHTTCNILYFGQPTPAYAVLNAPFGRTYQSQHRFSHFSNNHVCLASDSTNPYIVDIRDNSSIQLGLSGQAWDFYPAPDSTRPSDVSGLAAVPGTAAINLSWNAATDAESGISGYVIFRGLTASPTQVLASIGNATSFVDDAGIHQRTYYYRVKSKNEVGLESANYSNEVSALMPAGLSSTLVITNTTCTSGRTLVWDTLAVGKLAYIDNTCPYTKVPARFEGFRYLKTANADRSNRADYEIGFTVNQAVTVYIAWDDRIPTPKLAKALIEDKWMTTYAFKGYNVCITCGGTENPHSLWYKDFPLGALKLGSPWQSNEMYTVIVTPQGAVSTGKEELPAPNASLTALPNPFTAGTTLMFSLPKAQSATLAIYNCRGKLVQKLMHGEMPAGRHQAAWNGAGLSSGIYVARLTTASRIFTQKLLLVK